MPAAHEVRVTPGGSPVSLSVARVRRAVREVLRGERAPDATVSVTFVTPAAMRRVNAKAFGRRRPTDVIAFRLPVAGGLVGDIYVCPAVARQSAKALRVSTSEELTRLLVHGTLHVLGYDHPAGPGRERSAMWRRQERYVRRLWN